MKSLSTCWLDTSRFRVWGELVCMHVRVIMACSWILFSFLLILLHTGVLVPNYYHCIRVRYATHIFTFHRMVRSRCSRTLRECFAREKIEIEIGELGRMKDGCF